MGDDEVVTEFAEGHTYVRFLHGLLEDIECALLKLLDVRKQVLVVLLSDKDVESGTVTALSAADEHAYLRPHDVDGELLSHSRTTPCAFRVVPTVVVLDFDYGDCRHRYLRFVADRGSVNEVDLGPSLVDRAVSFRREMWVAEVVWVVTDVVEEIGKGVRVMLVVG